MEPKGMTFVQSLAPALTAGAVLYSVVVLFAGAVAPGGGLAGGLVLAVALSLFGAACGADRLRRAIRLNPTTIAALGVLIAVAAGLPAWYAPLPYFSAMIFRLNLLGSEITLSTVVAFEIGVYLATAGAILAAALGLLEADD